MPTHGIHAEPPRTLGSLDRSPSSKIPASPPLDLAMLRSCRSTSSPCAPQNRFYHSIKLCSLSRYATAKQDHLDRTSVRALANYYLHSADLSSYPTNSAAIPINRIVDLYDHRGFFAASLANVNKASCGEEKLTARYISRQIFGNAFATRPSYFSANIT